MPTQLDHLDPLSDRELIPHGLVIGNTPELTAIERLLRVRVSEAEATGSRGMVDATQHVKATQRLGAVTWWLVAGTVRMGLAAMIDVALKLTKVVH